jgi:hypothetical protein
VAGGGGERFWKQVFNQRQTQGGANAQTQSDGHGRGLVRWRDNGWLVFTHAAGVIGRLDDLDQILCARPYLIEKLSLFEFPALVGNFCQVIGEVGEGLDDAGLEQLAESVVDGAEFEVDELIVEAWDAAAIQSIAQAVPGFVFGGVEFAPVEEDMGLVGVQIEGEAAVAKV